MSLPTGPVWVDADPARLEQIVVNLLNNAAKYTDAGGLVRMSVGQEGAEGVIRVRDNGVGIAPEMLPRIFDLFTQVDGALGRSHGGLGIGLALVRTLVEMQEGRVQAQSGGLGQGSEFTVRLPALIRRAEARRQDHAGAGRECRAAAAYSHRGRRRGFRRQSEHATAAVRP